MSDDTILCRHCHARGSEHVDFKCLFQPTEYLPCVMYRISEMTDVWFWCAFCTPLYQAPAYPKACTVQRCNRCQKEHFII